MLVIRMRREGAKKQPFFRLVVTEAPSPRDGKFIESLGIYDPTTKPETLKVDRERLVVYSEDSRKGQPWRHTPEPEVIVRSLGDGSAAHLANWLDCIRTRKQPNAPLAGGVAAARAGQIANQSILVGTKVRFEGGRIART